MSSDGQPPKKPHGSSTGITTPKYASITGSIQEEEDENEAKPSSTTPRAPLSRQQSASDTRREYGTINTTDFSDPKQDSSQKRPGSPTTTGTGPSSPSLTRSKSKPYITRRMSSSRRVFPHRGEHFSVDDDASEVEVDREQDFVPKTPRSSNFSVMSRQPSSVRRRTLPQVPQLARVESRDEDADADQTVDEQPDEEPEEQYIPDDDIDDDDAEDEMAVDDEDMSEAESFTLRDRQLAINETHPFGIRIWKPALYKKNRSVEKNAEEDIHSSPSQIVGNWLWVFNCLWTIIFGWWLALAAVFAAVVCYIFGFEPSALAYGRVFWGLAGYLFWPFGQFVKLEQDKDYVDEDEGEGRSISEYERWQSGDLEYGRLMFGTNITHVGSIVGRRRESMESASERDSLLERNGRLDHTETSLTSKKRRLFGRGQWTLGRIVFFAFFYFFVAPLMLLVSFLCWFMVFFIPMGRVLTILFYHVRKRPLALTFHPDVSYARDATKPSQIILCTYRAAGLKYWKYTIDGTNIFLFNFLAVTVFVIFDYFVLKEALGIDTWITSPALLFVLALISVIPLAYFIGQAVASISAQSSMGMGAAVNAFFSTIVEVFLYCVALKQGKAQLVEGSIIGSIFAGILLLPGLSMCFGALKRKTQRFNVKSAGATSTMLLFAMIAAFGPTLFYKIYGSHELICKSCDKGQPDEVRDCRQCYFRQHPAASDAFFVGAVRYYCWFAAVLLFLSYIIGLFFTLRTHAAVIWSTELDEKRAAPAPGTTDVSPLDTRRPSVSAMQSLSNAGSYQAGSVQHKAQIRDTQLYKRILGQSLRSAGLENHASVERGVVAFKDDLQPQVSKQKSSQSLPHRLPPAGGEDDSFLRGTVVPGLTEEENETLVRRVAELAATAATVAARDAVHNPRQAEYLATHTALTKRDSKARASVAPSAAPAEPPSHQSGEPAAPGAQAAAQVVTGGHEGGGHDAPNWSRMKSSVILLTATVAYAIIAEVLVTTVDVVLASVDIDQKFLGITLFALVPNTTEFLNAISFAMNGNIALSMEIGSAYALQVTLLQIPALVLFSAVHGQWVDPKHLASHTFNLIFPQWDMVTVILCTFLLSYMYSEGKSNYFKGSILVLTYLVVIMGFYFSGFTGMDVLGVDPDNTLALTVGQWDHMRSSRPGREL